MHEPFDELDEALDRALASYGKAPERSGLERRILARVSERTARRHRMTLAMVATCAAALVTICLFWWVTPKAAVPPQQASNPESVQPAKLPLHKTDKALVLAIKPKRQWKQRGEPKLRQFPAPVPLGSQERALLELASHEAKHGNTEAADLDSPISPIEIAAVEIKPVE